MRIIDFFVTYILPPFIAGIFAAKLGKPIQNFLERLFNRKN